MNKAKTVARVDFPLAGKGQDATAVHALETLRTKVIPPVMATLPPGTREAVTGDTAGTHDFNQTMKHRAPIVFAFVLAFAFLLLLLTFRSIVIPLKAIILNLLSVGAAYGVLVWNFQDGHLQWLLGFHSNGAVVTWLPPFLFTVLFGLSMDYHVFILSRVKELVDRGMPTDQAVERGIRTTASTKEPKGIGEIHPSGFLPLSLGNVTHDEIVRVYREHPVLRRIRAADFGGRCGRCPYRELCGGSRARAYASAGDPLAEDPACAYQPAY